jgi:hypothetical protein
VIISIDFVHGHPTFKARKPDAKSLLNFRPACGFAGQKSDCCNRNCSLGVYLQDGWVGHLTSRLVLTVGVALRQQNRIRRCYAYKHLQRFGHAAQHWNTALLEYPGVSSAITFWCVQLEVSAGFRA